MRLERWIEEEREGEKDMRGGQRGEGRGEMGE